MQDQPESDDNSFDAFATWMVKWEAAQNAYENTSWAKSMAKLERAIDRARARESDRRMTDKEIRGRLLKHFYNLRHSNGGWVPAAEEILAGPNYVGPSVHQVVASACQQLADARFVEWKPLVGASEGHVIGMARITALGVDVVNGDRTSSIAIHIPVSEIAPPVVTEDPPISDGAIVEIHEVVSSIRAELPALGLSNSEQADIIADIKHIEVETERPAPRQRFVKLYLESLRDSLAKAAGTATAGGLVALVAAVGGLLAKHFGIF